MPKDLEIAIIFKRKLIFEELKNLLSDVGIKTIKCNSLKEFNQSNNPEELLIIELDSDKSAEKVIKLKKNQFNNMEIICLVDKNSRFVDELKDFRIIKRPFSFSELLSLINKINNRKSSQQSFVFRNIIYIPKQAKFINNSNNIDIKLTDLENKLILFILKNKNGVSKKSILQNVWKHKTELNTHTLESLIYRLRRKIEDDPNNPKILTQIEKKYFLKTEDLN